MTYYNNFFIISQRLHLKTGSVWIQYTRLKCTGHTFFPKVGSCIGCTPLMHEPTSCIGYRQIFLNIFVEGVLKIKCAKVGTSGRKCHLCWLPIFRPFLFCKWRIHIYFFSFISKYSFWRVVIEKIIKFCEMVFKIKAF